MKVINLYQCDAGFTTEKRVFDYDYLLYVHSGKGIYKIGSTSYTAAMGDLFYCPPFVGNTIIADSKDPFLLSGVEFCPDVESVSGVQFCPGVQACEPDYRRILKTRFSLLSNRFLIETVWEMIREYRYGKIGSEEICDALLAVLLENLQRMSQGAEEGKTDPAKEILDYIADNLHRPITHQELSRVFSYHKNSINRLLVRETGLSLKNYVIELRIRKASELLKYSNKSIGEIGEFCGYNSAVFFSRQFREKTGMTPMQFRNSYLQHQKQEE